MLAKTTFQRLKDLEALWPKKKKYSGKYFCYTSL